MALGWPIDQVEDYFDIPRIETLLEIWDEFPPLYMLPRMLAAWLGAKTERTGSKTPAAGGWTEPRSNSLPERMMMGQVDGGVVNYRTVSKEEFAKIKDSYAAKLAAFIATPARSH